MQSAIAIQRLLHSTNILAQQGIHRKRTYYCSLKASLWSMSTAVSEAYICYCSGKLNIFGSSCLQWKAFSCEKAKGKEYSLPRLLQMCRQNKTWHLWEFFGKGVRGSVFPFISTKECPTWNCYMRSCRRHTLPTSKNGITVNSFCYHDSVW